MYFSWVYHSPLYFHLSMLPISPPSKDNVDNQGYVYCGSLNNTLLKLKQKVQVIMGTPLCFKEFSKTQSFHDKNSEDKKLGICQRC